MTVIVTDQGFAPDTLAHPLAPLDGLTPDTVALDLAPTDQARAVAPHLARMVLIRIAFPAFNDGRGFTLARDLRRLGYTGRLRAAGHVLADQYAMARRAGFDEVEISDTLAARQPWPQWQARADWQAHDHRTRLFA